MHSVAATTPTSRSTSDSSSITFRFRGIAAQLGEVEGPGGEVLRYGIELMDWNAAWWADLERRLS